MSFCSHDVNKSITFKKYHVGHHAGNDYERTNNNYDRTGEGNKEPRVVPPSRLGLTFNDLVQESVRFSEGLTIA